MADAGWYEDPTDAAGLRYWDGSGWTDHTRPAEPPVSVVDAPPPAAWGTGNDPSDLGAELAARETVDDDIARLRHASLDDIKGMAASEETWITAARALPPGRYRFTTCGQSWLVVGGQTADLVLLDGDGLELEDDLDDTVAKVLRLDRGGAGPAPTVEERIRFAVCDRASSEISSSAEAFEQAHGRKAVSLEEIFAAHGGVDPVVTPGLWTYDGRRQVPLQRGPQCRF